LIKDTETQKMKVKGWYSLILIQ